MPPLVNLACAEILPVIPHHKKSGSCPLQHNIIHGCERNLSSHPRNILRHKLAALLSRVRLELCHVVTMICENNVLPTHSCSSFVHTLIL
eukprot:4379721-Amphidinium_carterae.1